MTAVAVRPPTLIRERVDFRWVSTLTHDGDELRHFDCYGREPFNARGRCYCIYHWIDLAERVGAEYIARVEGWELPVAVCGECAGYVRAALEVRTASGQCEAVRVEQGGLLK